MSDASYELTVEEAELARQVGPMLGKTAAALTRRIAAQAKVNAPVDTGYLARSITETPVRFATPFRVTAGVEARADYARYVHDGTRPHVIAPRRAGGVLAWQSGGQTVFARRVFHPGTTARPFLKNAADTVLHSSGIA